MQDFLQSEAPYLVVAALFLTGLLLRFRPEKSEYLNTLSLFIVGMVGLAVAALLQTLTMTTAASGTRTVFGIVAAVAFIRLCGFGFFRLLLPVMGRRPPRIVEDLTIVIAYLVFGFAGLRAVGVDLSSLLTTSAILTAVLAFSMQDTIGNVLGGIAVQLDQSVQIGDWVRVDDVVGKVRDIRWRSTLIETRNWETVVVPNGQLMRNRVVILGRREGSPLQWRRILNFMVDPGVPPARVIALLSDEMREVSIPNVARLPAASCVLIGFEEGNLRYQLRYFLTDLNEDDFTDSMVRVHIFASLQRAGIRVAEPQRTVHAVQRDEAHEKTVRRREQNRRLGILKKVDLFAGLSDEERAEIADRLEYSPFARGDVITRQGDSGHWLYIVAFGEADVLYEGSGSASRTVGTVGTGEYFGEMALFAGEARHATVVAKTDVECYRLDRASVHGLLLSRPEIAEQISKVVAARRGSIEQARAEFSANGGNFAAERQPGMLSRIRRFFGLGT